MCKINLTKDKMAMWVVCTAIAEERDKLKGIESDENGMYDIKLLVNGIEFDFQNVVKSIDKQLDDLITSKAQEIISDRYNQISGELIEIEERIKEHREMFKYEWE